MAKIKKFDVLTVPVEVEYINPILGRLFRFFAWFMLLLIVPRFLKGGGACEE